MQKLNLMAAFLIIMLSLQACCGSPILDRLFQFSSYQQPDYSYGNSYTTRPRPKPTTRQGRTYKDICRVVNPNQYAFPNRVPYPAGELLFLVNSLGKNFFCYNN